MPPAVAIDGDEGQVGAAGHPPHAGQRLLREHLDLDFERRAPRGGDARLEDDQVADLDRVQELQAVDRGGDEQAARVAVAGDGAGDVDEVHDRAAEDEPERVGVVRQDDLHHLRRGLGGRLGLRPSRALGRLAVNCSGSSGVDERLERAAQLRRQIFVADRAEQRDRRFVGLELGDAAGAARRCCSSSCVDVRRAAGVPRSPPAGSTRSVQRRFGQSRRRAGGYEARRRFRGSACVDWLERPASARRRPERVRISSCTASHLEVVADPDGELRLAQPLAAAALAVLDRLVRE